MNGEQKPSGLSRSLKLLNGDLILDNNDFATVRGQENFLQAMQVMIETPFGSDIFNVNYGFDLLSCISQPQAVARIKDLIRLNVVKSLSLDNRVREIREVVFDDEPRFYELNREPDPEKKRKQNQDIRRTERRWQALVVLQTISDGEVTLKLEGVRL